MCSRLWNAGTGSGYRFPVTKSINPRQSLVSGFPGDYRPCEAGTDKTSSVPGRPPLTTRRWVGSGSHPPRGPQSLLVYVRTAGGVPAFVDCSGVSVSPPQVRSPVTSDDRIAAEIDVRANDVLTDDLTANYDWHRRPTAPPPSTWTPEARTDKIHSLYGELDVDACRDTVATRTRSGGTSLSKTNKTYSLSVRLTTRALGKEFVFPVNPFEITRSISPNRPTAPSTSRSRWRGPVSSSAIPGP